MSGIRPFIVAARVIGARIDMRYCVAAAVGIAAFESSVASAATVQSCLDDGGATMLRSVVASAASNDTINLPDCTISLLSGAIEIPQAKLTIAGVKGGATEISAQGHSRVFHHTGNDQLV